MVTFKETSFFTEQIQELATDDEYAALQWALVKNPKTGPVVPGSGGVRKVRWSAGGGGKRGGLRIMYYLLDDKGEIYMLFAYSKKDTADLTKKQIGQLKDVVKEELG